MNGLRSVNIADDLLRQDVLASYRSTRKSLQVVWAVCGFERSRATHIVAPYGAGKSIAALAGITLLVGTDDHAEELRRRIDAIDPDLLKALTQTTGPSRVLLLHGACPDLPDALCRQAGISPRDSMKGALTALLQKVRKDGVARLAIVWDEFGQHLETLVREGRTEDLLAVQDLAEWAVRRSRPSVTFTTLMHQGVYHYTRRVSDSAQSVWRKIEGRFDTLSLLDDGVDTYEMIADVLVGERDGSCHDLARRSQSVGFFPSFGDVTVLARVLARTAPLTPAALDVLPRLAVQVAQNERTMFRCLEESIAAAAPGTVIGLDAIYDYFAPAMRADTGPSGTHRRLVEAETALSRTDTSLQRLLVKAATLLQLGAAGERVKLPRDRLVFAVTEGTNTAREEAEAEIDTLVDRKVLLHRRRIDDVSVWHGADLDLASMVAEEAARVFQEQDIAETLERLFPPDAYTAPRYNYERAITRFARARFVVAGDLLAEEPKSALRHDADAEDALVALLVDSTAEREDLRAAAATLPPHLIAALPRRSAEVAEILADLMAVKALLDRSDLLETDPLVASELLELQAEAEMALRQALERLMNPDRGEVVWLSGGAVHDFASGANPGEILTRIFETRFPDTPYIRSEQVVRRKVTAVTRSARKRCILAIIERTGTPSLGYDGATSADASTYRTVFERTGMYALRGTDWRWARPTELSDPGMRRVWEVIGDFFSRADDHVKGFQPLVERLSAPPIGLREGLFPLLIAAGLRNFGRGIAVREFVDGRQRYVDDIQPSLIERLCEAPSRFELEVFPFTTQQTQNLELMVREVVYDLDPHEPDLVRAFYDGLLDWRNALPPSALTARGLGEAADLLQPLLRRRSFDPLNLVVRELPRALGDDPLSDHSVRVFRDAVAQIGTVAEAFATKAAAAATDLFNARISGTAVTLLQAAEAWAEALPLDEVGVRTLDQEARGILSRSRAARNAPRGELGFVTMLSGILFGIGFDEWDDRTIVSFRDRLESAVHRLEIAALDRADGSPAFAPFLKNRLANIFDQYSSRIGREALMQYIEEIYREGR